MSKYTYISSSILACSWGGQLVQFPGSEKVKPASNRPASTFFAISTFNSRREPGLPVANFIGESLDPSAKQTTLKGYSPVTSAENPAKSTEVFVVPSMAKSGGI